MQLALLTVFLGDSCTFFLPIFVQLIGPKPPLPPSPPSPLLPPPQKKSLLKKGLRSVFRRSNPLPPNGGMDPGYNSHTLAAL